MLASPSIILVRPQLPENIGLVARAMGNFGVKDLRLVAPQVSWPSALAQSSSVGAQPIIDSAKIFSSLQEAMKDLSFVVAATARHRDIKKTTYTPQKFSDVLRQESPESLGLVFGPEKSGLTNEDISFCNAIFSFPLSSDLPSLNLSHAVALSLYELSRPHLTEPTISAQGVDPRKQAALQEDVLLFLSFLESALKEMGFFSPPEKEEKMRHNLRDIFLRRPLSTHDLNSLFGAVRSLWKKSGKPPQKTK